MNDNIAKRDLKTVALRQLKGLWWLFGLLLLVACGGQEQAALPTATETSLPPTATAVPASPTTTELSTTSQSIPTETAVAPNPTETAVVAFPLTFKFNPERTEVRFKIDEELLGNSKTVIGSTNEVSGEIVVDPAFAKEAEVSQIVIDASTLLTDDSFRNRSLRQFILQSGKDEYQFIIFTPTRLDGVPATVAIGETITFQIVGDLVIRDITQVVTFEISVTLTDATHLVGTAETTVERADYSLTIPSVPGVANVAEEFILQIDFQAIADQTK